MRISSCLVMAFYLSVCASCSQTERAQTQQDEQPTQDTVKGNAANGPEVSGLPDVRLVRPDGSDHKHLVDFQEAGLFTDEVDDLLASVDAQQPVAGTRQPALNNNSPDGREFNPGQVRPSETVAVLGAEFRAPTNAESKRFGIAYRRGQIVETIVANGNVDTAGIRKGDAILKLDENAITSNDAIRDFLRVTKPGQKVRVTLKRAETLKTEEVHIKLSRRRIAAEEARKSRFTWNFAGLAQLNQALAHAKKQNKQVIVGLSGAET